MFCHLLCVFVSFNYHLIALFSLSISEMNIVTELLGYWAKSSLKSTQQMGNKNEQVLLLTEKLSSFNVSLGAVYSFSMGLKFKENRGIFMTILGL